MEPIKDSDFALDVELYGRDIMFSDSWDEEDMSVSNDSASEESFAVEDNDANEDLELIETDSIISFYEDEDMSVNNDAVSVELSAAEHNDDEDLEFFENVTVYSDYEDKNCMDLSEVDEDSSLVKERGDDEDLKLYAMWYEDPEDADYLINEDIDGSYVTNEDLKFARDACELHIDELVSYSEHLGYLDLAATRCVGYRKWRRKVLAEYFHLKCPALMQDKIDTLRALVGLGKTLNFPKLYEVLVEEQMERLDDMESEYFYSYQTRLLESLKSSNRKSKRRSILRFIRLERLLRPSLDIDNYPIYREMFAELMFHIRKDFKDDSEFIIYVLHNLCTERKMQFSVFVDEDTENLEFLIGHALKQKYDFWLLYDDRKCPYLPHNILSTCMSNRNCHNTQTLLKYGFPYVFTRLAYRSLCREVLEDPCWTDELTGEHDPGLLLDETGTTTLLELSNYRSQMVLQVFHYFLKYPISSDCIKVWTKWSRSIPDPYVTPKEMHDSLKNYVKCWFKNDLVQICRRYTNMMVYDDDHTVMTPRKLSHLSRCVVRKQLKNNYQLPHGIEKLGMPKIIRNYLLLEL